MSKIGLEDEKSKRYAIHELKALHAISSLNSPFLLQFENAFIKKTPLSTDIIIVTNYAGNSMSDRYV